MNDGVKILLARMETHPEEFEAEGKWISSFNSYKKYMTEEEKDVFWKKLCELKMSEFEKKIVKRLMQEEEPDQLELSLDPYKTVILPSSITYTSEPLVNKKPTTLGKLFNYT
jgi:alpha-amylase/alpha-mannosidase (GH57 family)